MKRLFLKINVTTGVVSQNNQPISDITIKHGDDVLFCVEFVESLPDATAESPLDLTGALGLRSVNRDAVLLAGDLLTFQDSFNQGDWDEESLPDGKVSWLQDFGTAAITTELGSETEIVSAHEFDYLTAGSARQTLGSDFAIIIRQQLNDWAGEGFPAPPTTCMLLVDAQADFVPEADFIAPLDLDFSDSPYSLVSTGGIQEVRVDTTGGDVIINLEALATANVKYNPEIIKVAGSNKIIVSTNAAELINGLAADQDVTLLYYGLVIYHTAAEWVSFRNIMPS